MATLYKASQFFITTLNVGGGIDSSQTTGITIADDSGIDDVSDPGIALINYADPLNTSIAEWVTYTSISSKVLQGVTRGAEGFAAKAHDNAVQVAFPLSKSHINNLADALAIGGSLTNGVTGVLDEDDMASNSAVKLATQQSIKAYVDASIGPPKNAARAYMSANQANVASSTPVKLVLDSTSYNVGSAWNTTDKRFVVPTGGAGLYLIYLQVYIYDFAGSVLGYGFIYKNGSAASQISFTGTAPNIQQVFSVLNLADGDYIEGYGQINTTNADFYDTEASGSHMIIQQLT